jgi:group I intron endonuclease
MVQKYHYDAEQAKNFNPFDGINLTEYTYPKEIFRGFVSVDTLDRKTLEQPGVYLLYHRKTDLVYIGSAHEMWDRIRTHLNAFKFNKMHVPVLQEAWNDDEWISFYFKPTADRESAFDGEQEMLDKYFGKPGVVNTAPNARNQTGYKHREDTIEKMVAKRNTPEMKAYMSNLQKGRERSPEWRKNVSEKLKGRPASEKNKQITSALFKGVKRTEEVTANIRAAILAKTTPISIKGVIYQGTGEASKALGIGKSTVKYRIASKSEEFKDWFRMEKKSD